MFLVLTAAQEALSVVREAASLGSAAVDAGHGGVQAQMEAMHALLDAASDAITSAEYLAMLGSTSSSSQHQAGLAAVGFMLAEQLQDVAGFPVSARPVLRTTFGFALASDLVAQHHVRQDIRGVIAVVGRLAVATHHMRRHAGKEGVQAASGLLEAVERCYATLPGVVSPWGRVVRRSQVRERDAAFRAAIRSAWEEHAQLLEIKVVRTGVLRRPHVQYPTNASVSA